MGIMVHAGVLQRVLPLASEIMRALYSCTCCTVCSVLDESVRSFSSGGTPLRTLGIHLKGNAPVCTFRSFAQVTCVAERSDFVTSRRDVSKENRNLRRGGGFG